MIRNIQHQVDQDVCQTERKLNKKFSLRNRFTRFEGKNLPGKRRKRGVQTRRSRVESEEVLFEKEERRKKKEEDIQREAREEMSSPLKIIDLDASFVVIHRYLPSILVPTLEPVFLLLAITSSIISSESQQSWHLACIPPLVDNFTFLHELNVYSITAPRPCLDKGILTESGSTRN